MKTTIIILSFFFASAIGQGVKEIRLAAGSLVGCGGVNIGIKIQTRGYLCTVIPKPQIFGKGVATWKDADLGNCASFNVDGTSVVYFQTTSTTDGFCPELLQIFMDDRVNTRYEAEGDYYFGYFKNTHNNSPYGVTKAWPLDGTYIRPQDEPLLCPRQDHDTCLLSEMYAYQIGSRDRKNCLFECSTVASVRRTTTYSETRYTGFRCVDVDYDAVQFDWCCKTKSTQGGIPYCPDVLTNSSNQSVSTTATPVVVEVPTQAVAVPGQCPQSGCPIRNVKTYYDVQEPHTYDMCEIRFECDYVLSANPYDPESGVECTRTNSPRRNALKCCNLPTAESDLPQCSDVRNRNVPPVQNNTSPVQNDTSPVQNDASPVQNNASPVQNNDYPVQAENNYYRGGSGNSNVQELVDNQPQGSLADGCPTSNSYLPKETIENPEHWQIGAVRCCSHDGRQCVTPDTPCIRTTFESAKGVCNTKGMRLCKPEELSGGRCCQTGCRFDGELVWQMTDGGSV